MILRLSRAVQLCTSNKAHDKLLAKAQYRQACFEQFHANKIKLELMIEAAHRALASCIVERSFKELTSNEEQLLTNARQCQAVENNREAFFQYKKLYLLVNKGLDQFMGRQCFAVNPAFWGGRRKRNDTGDNSEERVSVKVHRGHRR
jgi:hypothetical protein